MELEFKELKKLREELYLRACEIHKKLENLSDSWERKNPNGTVTKFELGFDMTSDNIEFAISECGNPGGEHSYYHAIRLELDGAKKLYEYLKKVFKES